MPHGQHQDLCYSCFIDHMHVLFCNFTMDPKTCAETLEMLEQAYVNEAMSWDWITHTSTLTILNHLNKKKNGTFPCHSLNVFIRSTSQHRHLDKRADHQQCWSCAIVNGPVNHQINIFYQINSLLKGMWGLINIIKILIKTVPNGSQEYGLLPNKRLTQNEENLLAFLYG